MPRPPAMLLNSLPQGRNEGASAHDRLSGTGTFSYYDVLDLLAGADEYELAQGGSLTGESVLANDLALGINGAGVELIDGPRNGTLTMDPVTGQFSYTPAPGFFGIDAFVYRTVHGTDAGNPVMVTLMVRPQEVEAADAAAGTGGLPVLDDQPILDALLDEGEALLLAPGGAGLRGTIAFDPGTGEFTFGPAISQGGPGALGLAAAGVFGPGEFAPLHLTLGMPTAPLDGFILL